MRKRRLNDLPDGIRNRMIRLTVEYAVLTNRNPQERIKALDAHHISYRAWQTRSYHLMIAINQKLIASGKKPKYEFNQ